MNWCIILVLIFLFLFLDNLGIPAGGKMLPTSGGFSPPINNITKILPTRSAPGHPNIDNPSWSLPSQVVLDYNHNIEGECGSEAPAIPKEP